jgi:hypothetical protein
MKINWLKALCWALIVGGFAVKLWHYSVFNIPYFGFLITAIGVAGLYFIEGEKQEKIDK